MMELRTCGWSQLRSPSPACLLGCFPTIRSLVRGEGCESSPRWPLWEGFGRQWLFHGIDDLAQHCEGRVGLHTLGRDQGAIISEELVSEELVYLGFISERTTRRAWTYFSVHPTR